MIRRVQHAVLLGVLLIVCNAATRAAEPAASFPIRIIEVAGSADEVGAGHGRQLGEVIRELHKNYLTAYFSSDTQRLIAMTAAAAFEAQLLPEHRAEVRAMAKLAEVDPRQMVLAQCFLDLSPMTACSTVTLPASAAPDGVARFGRNLDFPSFDIADKFTVVLVFKPEGRNAFVSVGWPGMAGVLSGMNEHGLSVANMEVKRGVRLPSAMPYTMLYRTVLEQCRTTDEAIALLEKTPRQTPNNLMVMDADGNRAVVEITPQKVTVRRGAERQDLLSTNHHRGVDCETLGRCNRYDALLKTSQRNYGRIDGKALQSMLAASSQGEMTLQSMIFEPVNKVIHLAAGANAAKRKFHRLDLKPYFEGEQKSE